MKEIRALTQQLTELLIRALAQILSQRPRTRWA
jgi:hypothetical protein